jgi:hypothetical protein
LPVSGWSARRLPVAAWLTGIDPHAVIQAELALHAGLVRVLRSSGRSLKALCIGIGRVGIGSHAVTQAALAVHGGLARVIRSPFRAFQAIMRYGIGCYFFFFFFSVFLF